jgi:hypothetical protein
VDDDYRRAMPDEFEAAPLGLVVGSATPAGVLAAALEGVRDAAE